MEVCTCAFSFSPSGQDRTVTKGFVLRWYFRLFNNKNGFIRQNGHWSLCTGIEHEFRLCYRLQVGLALSLSGCCALSLAGCCILALQRGCLALWHIDLALDRRCLILDHRCLALDYGCLASRSGESGCVASLGCCWHTRPLGLAPPLFKREETVCMSQKKPLNTKNTKSHNQ